MDAREQSIYTELAQAVPLNGTVADLLPEIARLVSRLLTADGRAGDTVADHQPQALQVGANILMLAIERVQAGRVIEQRVEERTHAIEQRLVAAAQEKAVLEERQRLARDLHDSVTQALYGVTLHAEAAARFLAMGDIATTATYLRDLQSTAQEALDEMRLLIFDLRPPILEQAGLVAALQARLDVVEGRASLQTQLAVQGVTDLPAVIEQALYRIAQEMLNNTLKHASAHRISVQLQQSVSGIALEIADDGIGFDLALLDVTGGLGLRGIRERVAQLNGRIRMESAPGRGTRMRVEIDL